MITPAVASSISQFYALGNTPAVNLTRDLPQGIDASILLLGCGDIRNILYTAYANTGLNSRTFDVTLCDIDEAIIARNIVLLSLILDSNKDVDHSHLWNINFHIYLSLSDIEALCAQVEKLLNASGTISQWKDSHYGMLLPFCDQATLDDVRDIWTKYAPAGDKTSRDASIAASKKILNNSMAVRAARIGGTPQQPVQVLTGIRSAAPLSIQSLKDVPLVNQHFWKTGVTGAQSETIPNPLISACLSDHKLLHYGTDPLLGFHLATAFTPLGETSPLGFDADKEKFKVVAAAKVQFNAWVDATSALFASKKLVVRSVVADAFAFCHALQHLASNASGSAGWYKRQFDDRPLQLDGDSGLPTSFNVIDTSNLADHFGTLNLLTSALPLLSSGPSATLATETLLKGGADDGGKDLFNRILCGHGPSVALLLGVGLVEHWTNTTVESKVGEVMVGAKMGKDGVSQLHTRASWKHVRRLAGSQATLDMAPDHLATMLFQIYLKMFQHEDAMSIMSAAMGGMGLNSVLPSGYTHFHRASFVNLLKYVKGRFPTIDFAQTCAALDSLIAQDQSLAFGSNNAQEFGAQLHIQGLTSPPWLRTALVKNPSLGGFNAWKSIPEVVAVTLIVPRDQLDRLYSKSPSSNLAAPCFIGSLVSSQGINMFSDVQLTFGNVSKSGSPDRDDFAVILKKDPAGWSGRSSLIASFYVPTAALQVEPRTAGVGLDVLSTAQSTMMFRQILGTDMRVYKAQLRDTQHVLVTKFMPGHHSYPLYSASANAVKDEEVNHDGSESKASFKADVDSSGKVTTVTGHLDILSEKGKGLLTDKVPIELRQSSPFTINVVFGDDLLVLPLHFAHPVDSTSAKTRIARKSAYFEVIVPLADPLKTPALFDSVYPSVLESHQGQLLPATLNAPHLSLESLPILDLQDKSAIGWLTTLTSFQFSPREKRQRQESATTAKWQFKSPRLNFKESLFTLFMLGSGLQGGQTGLFAIDHPDRGGIHMLLLVSAFRLDAAAGSVVLDAAVLPFTPELVRSSELSDFLYILRTLEICSMTVDDDELILWKKVLPALAERARTWSHKVTCEYAAEKKIPRSIEPNGPVLCSCGQGKLPKDFIAVPEWDVASQYATRIAISPTFAVPFVEEIIDTNALAGGVETRDRCANCGATEAKDGGLLKRCRRCMTVMYCSAECQKKDWKKHRGECEETE